MVIRWKADRATKAPLRGTGRRRWRRRVRGCGVEPRTGPLLARTGSVSRSICAVPAESVPYPGASCHSLSTSED